MIFELKMKTEIFDSFWIHVNQFETENFGVVLSEKIVHFLFKNGVTANIQ